MKILIAENDPSIRKTLELCLTGNEVEIICSNDGNETLQKIEFCEPDILLLSSILPRVSTLEILRQVKNRLQPFPVIMVSATKNSAIVDQAKKSGLDSSLTMPFNLHALNQKIATLTGLEVCN